MSAGRDDWGLLTECLIELGDEYGPSEVARVAISLLAKRELTKSDIFDAYLNGLREESSEKSA